MAKLLPISFIWVTKMRQKTEDRRQETERFRRGSAIILAIVLTTLLAMLGVLFLLSSRVDSVTTSAIGDNQDLKLAVDTVISQISEVISLDVPRTDANGVPIEEYYDYPDDLNPWLASLEPNDLGVWLHVTDLYYPKLGPSAYYLAAKVIYDHNDHAANGIPADADGDGASDSMWVQVPDKMSAKGKPIYVAVRIIDNGGMLNVNTGYKFDPNSSVGSTQLDINLMALSWRPNSTYDSNAESALRLKRDPSNLANYENNVIWRYGPLNSAYTPFDISDELEMRYRFVINQKDTRTRLESWSGQFNLSLPGNPFPDRPFDNSTSPIAANVPKNWRTYAQYDSSSEPNYAYRHIATTYNMDRIIEPNGSKMFNINSPLNFDVNSIRDAVRGALDPNIPNDTVALITANLMDYIDGPDYSASDPRYDPNNEVTEVNDSIGTPHYGFERPCVYISEIAHNFFVPDINEPNIIRSYAIELFKPYWEDDEPNGWRIITTGFDSEGTPLPPNATTIVWTGTRRFHVLENIDANAAIPIEINEPNEANVVTPGVPQHADINFSGDTDIILQRNVNGVWVMVDRIRVPESDVNSSHWMEPNTSSSASHSFERDIASIHKCIRKILNPNMTTPTIGNMNHPFDSGGDMIQAHPANKTFTNVGEIGQLFRTDAYLTEPNHTEAMVRLDIADPCFQNLFNYLTVIDPYDHSQPRAETKIKGRININTAPWFVLAQLPWVSYHTPNYDLARSIVNNRDTYGAFKSTGELMRVGIGSNDANSMGYYIGKTNIPVPLMTPIDGAGDIFEERDVIFDRISNLVTVRSDVFTAYILVRIGTDGPQKRVIAILDRSGVTPNPAYNPLTNPILYLGKVKILAVQQVPDPR